MSTPRFGPYKHEKIEAKWQEYWRNHDTFRTVSDPSKTKFYVLDMFPYPSGAGLHVGHPKGYVATDIVARARRMMGFNVLRVMGLDSFGLPAERQAMKEHTHPKDIIERNSDVFRHQLQLLGLSYDWSREFKTSDATYYRWTQWIFLQLYRAGLAYEAEVAVNWCPALETVLANEEVKDGVYVETGDPVERRVMKQWMLKITDYAERLLEGLETLDWPEGILQQQRNWIGRSEGAEIRFAVEGDAGTVAVFSTRPDTLFGCTFLVLAPEHELVRQITSPEQRATVEQYVAGALQRSERDRVSEAANAEKTGVFTGAYATVPLSGARVPIWVADYVVAGYGGSAVFGCPAHDERDYAFARKFSLPVIAVIEGQDIVDGPILGDGPHVNSGPLDALNTAEATRKAIALLEELGAGEGTVRYRLHDWLFSRQRYWGEPIPMLHSRDGGTVPVDEADLPVVLPDLQDFTATPDGAPPLARAKDWLQVRTGSGEVLYRETNTMPQWAGSCWYYLRFVSPDCATAPWDSEQERYWLPVDLYVGGAEHATLHLLYARFWHRVLYDLGHVTTPEPFKRLFNQGMIHARTYRDARGKYYYADEVEERDGRWFTRAGSVEVEVRVEKMSKSKNNGVSPDDICRDYGADSLRLYELFIGPLEEGNLWETAGIVGVRRFLERVWRLAESVAAAPSSEPPANPTSSERAVERALHSAIKKVAEAVETLRFNTAVAEMMVFVNECHKIEQLPVAWYTSFIKILSPFAPHLCEEIWQRLGGTSSIADEPWPAFDADKIAEEKMTIAVQIDGKTRAKLELPAGAPREDVLAAAKREPAIGRWLAEARIAREIYVTGRLVNIVLEKR